MATDIFADAEHRMQQAVESLQGSLTTIRTGRASPALVERLLVDYYGTPTPLQQLAAIHVPEARTITIQPWDRKALPDIEKAIMKSDLGLNPNSDGALIRINIPPLTEDRRKEMIKLVQGKAEHGRVSIRTVRQDAIKRLQTQRKDKENPLSESDEKRGTEQVQKLVDKYIAEVDTLTKAKEAEMREV